MIRLSKQLMLLQNESELSQAGLKQGLCSELAKQHGGECGIEWRFDRGFWDDGGGKLTLLFHNAKEPKNEECCLTLRMERSPKGYRVTSHHQAVP
ncbi:hypothetical protein [Aestuariirhabdus sp. LZHN29]|uniref:hypothetical protein n=1 Tax=Aestuariirhabdus sp. LZHN29 TaxID=3417462 RepID=UPI003CEF723B